MRFIILIAGLLITGNTMAQFSAHRQLLIFKSEANAQLVQQQLDLLDNSDEAVKERAINVTVVEKDVALLNKYKVDAGQYTVILIGKDGSEKYRTNKILPAEELFGIVDAMPMRRREMKKN